MYLCLLEVSSELRLQLPNPGVIYSPRRLRPRLSSHRHFAYFTVSSVDKASSEPSISSQLTSTVGFSSYSFLTHRYIQFLSFTACTSFKRAAESLEKLMDVTGEELPDTMAAVRLSGMEISDLIVELSDLGQQINQGVRSSTRAVRLAEERLRWLANMKPIVSVQEVAPTKAQIGEPVLARSARNMRNGIVKGREVLQMLFTRNPIV